jgi:hypothetical protein
MFWPLGTVSASSCLKPAPRRNSGLYPLCSSLRHKTLGAILRRESTPGHRVLDSDVFAHGSGANRPGGMGLRMPARSYKGVTGTFGRLVCESRLSAEAAAYTSSITGTEFSRQLKRMSLGPAFVEDRGRAGVAETYRAFRAYGAPAAGCRPAESGDRNPRGATEGRSFPDRGFVGVWTSASADARTLCAG